MEINMIDKTKTAVVSTRNRNCITVLICFAGIILNLLLSYACGKLGLPLYLDTVGTIASAIIGGPLPGVIVGFFTNFFKSFSDPVSMYYGVINVLVALAASYFSKNDWYKKTSHLVLAVLIFAFLGGGLGSLVPILLNDVNFDAESLSNRIYRSGLFGKMTSHILANILTDFADKAISMAIVLLFDKILPDSAKKFFNFYLWKQTPLTKEASAAAKKTRFRVISLRTKILLVLSASLIAVSVGATIISMRLYRNALIKDRTKLAEGTAKIAASAVDPDKVDEYLENGISADGYGDIEKVLAQLRESSVDIVYVYVYKIMPDGCHVVFDVDAEGVEGREAGYVEPFDDGFKKYIPDLLDGKEIEPIITNDAYGWLLTAYEPVYNDKGECVCYAAADISMDQIAVTERAFLMEMMAIFLGFFILIFVFVRWLIEYHIILPVNSIAMSTGTFAYDNEKARESSIERIHELNITTGDEVENLYHAIAKTSDDSMRYVADVQKKTEELAQMQKALILVLADIVESRDKNTGAHVRKTAAYTEIILNELKKKGYYADVLTDEFISDVVNSAPLHDVGKIQVPDAILNKPGRLTDDEFAVMKTHTVAGHDIISQAIELVPNSGYLAEARNLAGYHHEKWDGTGYPYGVKGEDIPLSARVMAVADVFDALVSRRSYKEPMPYDKAMSIIKEGSGKHFDPVIVDAFVSADAEVRRVEAEFSQLTDAHGCFDHKTYKNKKRKKDTEENGDKT
jgi:response regulator RpfG family c-di-GMP phosphodiesterase